MVNDKEEAMVQKICNDYIEKECSKLDELVALDRKVKQPAKVMAYTVGMVGSLIFGTGMCIAMGVIGKKKWSGVVIGSAGMGLLAGNYYLYCAYLKERKSEYADRIIGLGNEISEKEASDETVVKDNTDAR